MPLHADLLGGVRFSFAGADANPRSRKGVALLAYLCLRPEGARREDLAELLWGPGRLANLRQELYALRRLPGAEQWLEDDGDAVSVRAETDIAGLSAQGGERAVPARSGGELLPGLERIDTPAFRDWLELERRRVAELVALSRREEADRLAREGSHSEALEVLDLAMELDPLDERLVRAAMRAAYADGDPAGALARFDSYRAYVDVELGLEPSPETLDLEARIRRGEPPTSDIDVTKLDADLRGLAQVIAVADGALDVESLARVVERRPLDVAADLARLERGGWLDRRLTLVPDARTSVLESTPAVVRRLLHQRAAQALREAPASRPGTVAIHLLAADSPTEAAPLLLEAAERSIARTELTEAVPYLLRAMWAAWDAPETRLQAALLLEGCAGQLGDEGLQGAALAEAEELAWRLQSDRGLADVRMRRSRTLLRRGRAGEGLESALEALEIATRLGDEQLIARARNAVGGAQFYAGDLDGAESSFAANAGAADPVERYRARNNLGSIAGVRGRTREALGHLEKALTLGRAAGEHAGLVGTLNNLAATAERVGEYRRAVKHFKEGLTLARQAGSLSNEGQILVNLAIVYSRLGELGPAWNTALEVEEMAVQQSQPRLRMLAFEQKAEVANLCGDHERTLELLGTARDLATAVGDERKQVALSASCSVVRARVSTGLTAHAEAELEELGDSRWADVTPWLWLELAMAVEDACDAERLVARAETVAGESDHLAMVLDLCRLRTALLAGASEAHREAGAAAHARLTGPGGAIETASFAQVPKARLLCACWEAQGSGSRGKDLIADGAERALAELTEQGAGLPRELRTCLMRQPAAWLARLDVEPLTLD